MQQKMNQIFSESKLELQEERHSLEKLASDAHKEIQKIEQYKKEKNNNKVDSNEE